MEYHDFFFEHLAKSSGVRPCILWEQDGPPDTEIEAHAVIDMEGTLFYAQNYRGGGFEVFVAVTNENSVDATEIAARKFIAERKQ